MNSHWFDHALEPVQVHRHGVAECAYQLVTVVADADSARVGELLNAAGDMHGDTLRLPLQGEPGVDFASNNFTRMQSNSERRRVLECENGLLHGECRSTSEDRVTFKGARGAECDFQSVSEAA